MLKSHLTAATAAPKTKRCGGVKNLISPFGDARRKKICGATIRIGRETWCLPYAEFFLQSVNFCRPIFRLLFLKREGQG